MVKSRFERKVLVSSDEEDEEKFSADETGINDNVDPKISSDDMKRFQLEKIKTYRTIFQY